MPFRFLETEMTLAHAQHKLGLRPLELCPDLIEQRIICAYIGLLFTPQGGECRASTVGWLGTREVRLTETIVDGLKIGTPPFAIEVYCHARSMVLDSYGCFELDDVELEAAVQLVLEAGRDVQNGLH
jgi:hypothetical protein